MNQHRVKIKICGVTNEEDANAIAMAGADAIGLVFYEASPRYVEIELAAKIASSLPAFVNIVGLFVDAEKSYINEVLNKVAIDTLQFHGQESEATCASYKMPYIKALRMQRSIDVTNTIRSYPSANAILLDTYVNDVPGGTGLAFDWQQFPQKVSKPLILAGGLSPENVQSAIKQTRPFAVDVSGGVEKEKGKKDITKVINFIREVNNV